ncbi:hypothetical protein JF535_08355 [Microbulbifer salipaludis]|uniref:Tetratricopeptide repeat protein n=1 Tax=Microbulbifer salipaludis TaxID=187980 RepID=A0ABS3E6D7_9GAMM|nr:hypothetical protein [Microbulbifer salipaludis]MBN8430863.1 hypothetical protein [Microbulbifer salipaludis]
MQSANRAYQEGRESDAEQLYKSSCERVVPLLTEWKDPEAAIAMLSVSYQNLADLYFRQGRYDDALVAYAGLLRQLTDLSQSGDRDAELARFAEGALHKAGSELSQEVRMRQLALPEDNPDLAPIRSLIS